MRMALDEGHFSHGITLPRPPEKRPSPKAYLGNASAAMSVIR